MLYWHQILRKSTPKLDGRLYRHGVQTLKIPAVTLRTRSVHWHRQMWMFDEHRQWTMGNGNYTDL